MGQRNMPYTSQMIDLEMDKRNQGYLHSEPCVVLGGASNFPQPIQTVARASGNTSSLDAHQHYDTAMFYGMPQYSGVHHHHHHHQAANLDMGVATVSNFDIPYMSTTPSSGMPLNLGSSDQLSSSSNFGVSADDYARHSHFMDNVRGSYKRKNTEGIPGSFQYLNAPASSSSSSVASLHSRHPDAVSPMDASFSLPQYRGNGTPSIREVESQRNARNRLARTAMDPVLAHCHNQFFQGNLIGQTFQPTGSVWLYQQSDGGASAWTQAPALPYMHVKKRSFTFSYRSSVNGASRDSENMVALQFPETAGSRSSLTDLHPSSLNMRHLNYHHPSPPIQGLRSHNSNVHSHVTAYRVPSSYAVHSTMNHSQDRLDMVPRHLGPAPPTGFRIYQLPGEGPTPEATLRQRNLPHLRVLPSDGVAVLEIPEFYEVGNFFDHHRDMRLDIEDMSYEELLALGERIGNVNTGLSEEAVTCQLKTRIYLSAAIDINLEEPATVDQDPDSCSICQEVYRDHEKIGTLDCGHEYHTECLKKWLFVKNVCPICKSEALAMKRKDVQKMG